LITSFIYKHIANIGTKTIKKKTLEIEGGLRNTLSMFMNI